ncbi:MAG TPA: Ig-like domain-containing protein [Gemmatimonadaceae bacterium]|nr:Ig-like domain-containing protein [Gemmatimonadaceae bacterium]
MATVVASLSCGGDVAGPSGARVATVTVQPSSTSLAIGSNLPLQATARDADGNVLVGRRIFFASNDENVATVTSDGVVTARAIGTAQIAASSEGQSAIAVVNVTQRPVATVTVLPSTAQLTVGGSVTLSAATFDSDGNLLSNRTVLWSSSNTNVATVDAQGIVQGRGLGSATISATSEGKTGSATANVTLVPVGSVTVSPTSFTLGVGAQTLLTATVRDGAGNVLTGRTVSWSSDAPSIASVSQGGLVTAAAAGSAGITASLEGKSATALITVTPATPPPPAIDRVTISPKDWEPDPGDVRQFVARAFDANDNEIKNVLFTWSSTNVLRVTVTQTGLALALRSGRADIIVTAGGKSATARVEVD